ncbi:MAG: methyltransferase domain-containing protein [Caulobacteraceae bacterium]|nr:methyltransferase domain-containing protein [Caulobacteraceae bacterium]
MDGADGNPLRRGWRRARSALVDVCDAATDLRLGISTRAPWSVQPLDPEARNVRYEALDYRALREIRRRVAFDPDDVFFDIGCGMGRALCWAARRPLRACIGVDVDPDLTAVARVNAERLRGRRAPIEVRTADATKADLAAATLTFMYNPFGAEVMRAVLAALARGAAGRPRPLRIVYAAPAQIAVFGEFAQVRETMRFRAPHRLGGVEVVVFAVAGS